MRWGGNPPKFGQHRHRSGFLWLPKTIQGETRWLEFADWQETYQVDFRSMGYGVCVKVGIWAPTCWLDH